MTFDAAKAIIDTLVYVALVAKIPFVSVPSRVNREVLRIVVERRIPIGRCMTVFAILRVAVVVIR